MNHLHELSILFLGSATSLLISAFREETVKQRFGIGGIMMACAIVLFFLT